MNKSCPPTVKAPNRNLCFELHSPKMNKVFYIQADTEKVFIPPCYKIFSKKKKKDFKTWIDAIENGSEYSSVSKIDPIIQDLNIFVGICTLQRSAPNSR